MTDILSNIKRVNFVFDIQNIELIVMFVFYYLIEMHSLDVKIDIASPKDIANL